MEFGVGTQFALRLSSWSQPILGVNRKFLGQMTTPWSANWMTATGNIISKDMIK